jgi:hypothetical protein
MNIYNVFCVRAGPNTVGLGRAFSWRPARVYILCSVFGPGRTEGWAGPSVGGRSLAARVSNSESAVLAHRGTD